MSRELNLYTAQAVRLTYRIADLGSRAAALMLDLLIQGAAALLLTLLLSSQSRHIGQSLALGLILTLNFVLYFGYYIVLEGIGAGQTIGKRVVGIRVVGTDGSHCGWGRSILRNLMRVVDWLPLGYAVGIATILTTRERRRVGDFVAGTLIVHVERAPQGDGVNGARPDPLCTLRAADLEAALPQLEQPLVRCAELMQRRRGLFREAFSRIAQQVRADIEHVVGLQPATDDARFLEHVLFLQQEIALPAAAIAAAQRLSLTPEERRKTRECSMRDDRRAREERRRLLDSAHHRGLLTEFDDATAWQAMVHAATREEPLH